MLMKNYMGNGLTARFCEAELKSRKMLSMLFIPAFLFFFSASWSRTGSNTSFNKEPVIARVNGFPLTIREFEIYLEESRTEVISHFIREYNLNAISQGFWEQEFDGQKPADLLKEIALQKAIQTKIRLVYMHEKNVIESPDYNEFLKIYSNFCQERNQTNGSRKFGPVQFSERAFFNYWYSNAIIELKNMIHYEDESCIPRVSEDEMQTGHRFSLLNSAPGTRKSETEIVKIFQERIQLYESNAEVEINNQILKDFNYSF